MNCPFSHRKTLRLRQRQPFRFAPLTTTTIKPKPLKHDPDSDPDPDGDNSRFKGYAVGGRLFPAVGFSSFRAVSGAIAGFPCQRVMTGIHTSRGLTAIAAIRKAFSPRARRSRPLQYRSLMLIIVVAKKESHPTCGQWMPVNSSGGCQHV